MQKNTRTSFTVCKKEWDFLIGLIKMSGLRRDTFIAKSLAEEMEEFKSLKTNTDEESNIIYKDFKTTYQERVKINILLPRQLMGTFNEVCKKKNVRRSCSFNRVIEFLNVRCGLSFLQLASPRKTLDKPPFQWLKIMAASSPSIASYVEYLEESMADDGEVKYIPFEGDPYWDGFYSSVLNVSPGDPRRLSEKEQRRLFDRLFDSEEEQ